MAYSEVICSLENHIAYITLNRPQKGNAIDERLAGEIAEICGDMGQNDDVRVVVVTGAGSVFCAGGDIEVSARTGPAASIAGVPQPVIAAINGDAMGEGLELALSCDIRVAADKARFGMPQVGRGLMPGNGGTQRLPRIVGRGRALEMLFTGAEINAEEALAMGLVSRVVPAGRLEEEARGLASDIAGKGPAALRMVKEAVNQGMDMTLEQGLRLEADLYFLLHTTADRAEGIRAFLEKRSPRFKNE